MSKVVCINKDCRVMYDSELYNKCPMCNKQDYEKTKTKKFKELIKKNKEEYK